MSKFLANASNNTTLYTKDLSAIDAKKVRPKSFFFFFLSSEFNNKEFKPQCGFSNQRKEALGVCIIPL